MKAFFLSLVYSCKTFKRWRTVGRLEINMTPLLIYIFWDRETCYLVCRKYSIKERCICSAVELYIKQCKEARQAFNEPSWVQHLWYLGMIYCFLRGDSSAAYMSLCRGSIWYCHLVENGTMKLQQNPGERLERRHKMFNKGNIEYIVWAWQLPLTAGLCVRTGDAEVRRCWSADGFHQELLGEMQVWRLQSAL